MEGRDERKEAGGGVEEGGWRKNIKETEKKRSWTKRWRSKRKRDKRAKGDEERNGGLGREGCWGLI